MPKHIAIIGAGFSGTMTALQLFRQTNRPALKVTLIDRTGKFGTGYAYSVTSETFLLNVRANVMGAWPEAPKDFSDWIKKNDYPATEEDFVPRAWYGKYLTELLSKPEFRFPADSLTMLHGEVESMNPVKDSHSWTLRLDRNRELTADAVVLALGNIERDTFAGREVEKYFSSPYDSSAYENLNTATDILVIGSSLSAVDAIVETEARGFRGRYTVLSRNGRLPLAHSLGFPTLEHAPDWTSAKTLKELFVLFTKPSRQLNDTQPALSSIRPVSQQCWNQLSLKDKQRFLRHVQPYWRFHRSRVPEAHDRTLKRLSQANRLQIWAGKIQGINRNQEGLLVETKLRKQSDFVKHIFARIFLAAGPERDVTRCEMPLLQSLLAKNLIKSGPLRLGATVATNHEKSLYHLGPLQQEDFWEITNVRELRTEATSVAQEICQTFSN